MMTLVHFYTLGGQVLDSSQLQIPMVIEYKELLLRFILHTIYRRRARQGYLAIQNPKSCKMQSV